MSGYMREIKEPYFNVNGTEPAMTKVTVEQAIELLRQHDTLVQDKGRVFYISIDSEQAESIANLIESLSHEAELGRLAEKAVDEVDEVNENFSNQVCSEPIFENSRSCRSCTWHDFCRLRADRKGVKYRE